MANKKPLIGDNGKIKQIADADNLLLPSMTITDGNTKTINISTDLAASTHNHALSNLSDINDTGITDGQTLAWNSTNSDFEPVNVGSSTPTPKYGVLMGGHGGGNDALINIFDTTVDTVSPSNYGNLAYARYGGAGVRGDGYSFCISGYYYGSKNYIDYVNNTTLTGSGTDRGDDTIARRFVTGVTGQTYGYAGGGYVVSSETNVISKITYVTTTTNATDRGDLPIAEYGSSGVTGPDYGFFCGGYAGSSYYVDISYIDITLATGNSIDSGDLAYAVLTGGGTSDNNSNAFVSGGQVSGGGTSNYIQHFDPSVTIGFTAVDKGDLIAALIQVPLTDVSSTSYSYTCGGYNGSAYINNVQKKDYTTSAGNASDQADLVSIIGIQAGA